MRVLGIETSCDETGIAIYDSDKGLLAHELYSQVAMHSDYGGVVPELASRDHVRRIIPLVEQVMASAGCEPDDIDGIAYTRGPGLAGALLVGSGVAKALAFAWGVPSLGMHHMEGHLLAPMIDESVREKIAYPFVALLVSGGHTQLINIKAQGDYELLGESLDDAAGEAFDKAAKMMDLGYPGGPLIAELAEKGTAGRFTFPRPMVDRPGLDFSFSGLKTFCLNTINEQKKLCGEDGIDVQTKADIALAFQQAVVETVFIKCRRALEQTGLDTLVPAGGVSANKSLRQKMATFEEKGMKVFYPAFEYCTDNGAMIAYAGCRRMEAGEKDDDDAIAVKPRWPLQDIS